MTTPTPFRSPRHARLTRSQVRAKISPTAKAILAAISYLLTVGVETALSHRTIARQARVGLGSVPRLMPVLAAEPGSGNTIPFIQRRWSEAGNCYLITLLPAPEQRGWYHWVDAPQEEETLAGASFTPSETPTPAADQLDFLGFLTPSGGSTIDPPTEIAVSPAPTPENAPKQGSMVDPSIFYVQHDQLLASSERVASAPSGQPDRAAAPQPIRSEVPDQPARTPTPQVPALPPPPVDERIAHMVALGVYPGLARRVLAAQPELTIAAFDRAAGDVQARGSILPAPVVVATVLARGEQVAAAPGRGQAAPPAERVSNELIVRAPIDGQTRGLWLSRFRQADSPDAKRGILARFRREVLGLAEPVRSA